MIAVKLMGGLGNQMFQYATGRRLAHKHGTELRLDTTVFDNIAEVDTPRHYELSCYKISGQVASGEELALMLPQDFKATLVYRIRRRAGLDTLLRPLGEHSKAFNEIVLRARNNTYLVGWWQNENYFKDIRQTLLQEFVPKKISAFTKGLLKQIDNEQAISIHVRRGDYISNKNANKEHGLAPIDYYKQAIKLMDNKLKGSHYYIFSDDLEWCKENLLLGKDAVFVDGNGADRACEDIYLMQHCRHNIVANSSFSWWGAWLNNNPDKIVIAPMVWFQNSQTDAETEIVPNAWTRL